MQQIQLTSGWNKVYTVLTLEDTEFDIVSDNRDMFVTSSGQLISTGNVGVTSNVLRITDKPSISVFLQLPLHHSQGRYRKL